MRSYLKDGGGLPGLSVRRPFMATVMNLLIVIAGLAAIMGVEVRELPDVDRPIVSVRALYPGASPTTVDAEVTSIVEAAVARVAGVVTVRSSSEEGNFRMHIEFRPDRELADAANDVREAVSRVTPRLPDGVEDLFVVKADQDARPIMSVAIWSDSNPIDELTRRIETEITPELTAVDGVADIAVFGARERVIRVEIAPSRLAAYGLSIGEVATLLERAQFDVPVGSFAAGDVEVLVRADATVADPARIQDLIIRDPVRLKDVADVYFGLATPDSVARLNGRLVVSLGIIRQAQSNTVDISDGIQRSLKKLQNRFPDLRFQVTRNDADFIEGAIKEVLTSLGAALIIVGLVIWAFMGRLGGALVPATAIPIALIGSVASIWLMGFSINLITLLALVLATGLVVDDAIVVVENIQRRRADGLGRRAASVVGARQVFFAVIATTVTLIAVFVPISFLPSDAGRLFGEFGFVLAVTVAISSFVALSICPMLSAQMPNLGGGSNAGARLGGRIAKGYAAVLRLMMAAPAVTLTVAGLLAGSAVLVYGSLGEELVPREDRGEVVIRMQGPDGTGLDYTDRQVAASEALLEPWLASGDLEAFYSVTGWYDLNRGYISARLLPWRDRDIAQADIEADLRPGLSRLPGARARVATRNSLRLRRGSDGGVTIALTGPSYPEIAAAADVFAQKMGDVPGLSSIRVQYQATQPQLSVQIDRARAADLGVSMTDLSATLRALIDEDEVAEVTIGDQATPIIVQSAAGAVRDPTDLLNLYVRTDTGRLAPLWQLVTFKEEGVAAELDRHGQRRAVEIDAAVDPSLTLAGAVEAIRHLAREDLPAGIGLLLLGEAAELDETSNALLITYLIALLVVFLVLVAQFESLTSAAVVMATVPFGIAAAIYALYLTGTTINIYSQIGVLMLIGIMAKNGILLVEFADQLRDEGASTTEAALEAALVRLRPIAMTLASTVLAGLPLILSSGPGAEARSAIGWVVFGGLGLAAVFTLFLTPVVYALLARLSKPRAAAGAALEAELAAGERRGVVVDRNPAALQAGE